MEGVPGDETAVLDSSAFGPNAKLLSCKLCHQKFTNKVSFFSCEFTPCLPVSCLLQLKLTMHWAINHHYKLCSLCSNYAFRYDSERIQHEILHLPFSCSSCAFQFNTVSHELISAHYKDTHSSLLCPYCSSVIEPYTMFPEHAEKKHNVLNPLSVDEEKLFELVGDSEDFFYCNFCNKKKPFSMLFGHYVFYHNVKNLQALKSCLEKTASVRINGFVGTAGSGIDLDVDMKFKAHLCEVCENPINSDPIVHEVFCRGFVMCDQKGCQQLFENQDSLSDHLELEHPISICKFGCNETELKVKDINKHLQNLHDIVECSLCDIINSSGSLKNHLRDKHSVDLMAYEKNLKTSSSKLYRVLGSRNKKQVFCNFCDHNITKEIHEFSFLTHYQNMHEIHMSSILRNLDKNPISDVMVNDKLMSKEDESFLKFFKIVVEKSAEMLIEYDFDASKVYCIGLDVHEEKKPILMGDIDSKPLICDFCHSTSFDSTCRLFEHLQELHGIRLLNLRPCSVCNASTQESNSSDDDDNKNFNVSLICPIDESFHLTKDHFYKHQAFDCNLQETALIDKNIYKCVECNFGYSQLDDMRVHFQQSHPDITNSYCKICRATVTPDFSHFHLNDSCNPKDEVKSVEKFYCKLCKKSFTDKLKAKTHYEKIHKKKKNLKKMAFKCQFLECSIAFENKEDRKMHQMISHPDEKIFQCKTCPMKFSTKSSLFSHNSIHKNIVNTCEFCSKTFIRRDSFKEHLLIHSGVRQKCNFCEKTFVQRSNLVRHERIHLNDKP